VAHGWILVIDDEQAARESVVETLNDSGCEALGASDGAEGRLQLESRADLPCMIILDLMMPGMNGWQFREWQRSTPRFSSVPVVVISAVVDLDRQMVALGVAEAISKPVLFGTLFDRVETRCGACRP